MGEVKNKNSPEYSIVLVNYKTKELTSICLKLLYKVFKDFAVQVWVVDNDSADGSTEYLRSLDWIHLIERVPVEHELGFMSHGLALDLALQKVTTDYVFILHTDTLVHDLEIFEIMLDKCAKDENIIAVGCVDQLYRGKTRIVWRLLSRFFKHYFRRLKFNFGLRSKQPKPYYEFYLKSFCALWNVKIMKKKALVFAMDDRNPGYEAQDQLLELGYKISYLSAKKMFKYLSHIQSGTVSAQGIYGKNHRRTKKYNEILEKMGS